MGDKRIEKFHNAINLNITALKVCDRKSKPHEIAYALIRSAFWVMDGQEGAGQYLEEVVGEVEREKWWQLKMNKAQNN